MVERCEGRVDIGTEWNLKEKTAIEQLAYRCVDIGTEWNLNEYI